MILGIMQPYFFPYIGYISLIKHVDKFILLDDVQFIRHGWIERNRILKPMDGWQYFRVPLKYHSRETKIKEILIDNEQNWKKKIIAQLQHYKKSSPFFPEVIGLLDELFDQNYFDITGLNEAALNKVCKYLNIETPINTFSKLSLQIEPVNSPDDWALNICKALNADEYWNPPGGKDLFNKSKYDANQIRLYFQQTRLQEYDQKRVKFEPGLSILDVMMFNSPDVINQMLDDYEIF